MNGGWMKAMIGGGAGMQNTRELDFDSVYNDTLNAVEDVKAEENELEINERLLEMIQNYQPPAYVEFQVEASVIAINQKPITIGDEVYYKAEGVNLIVKSIEDFDDEFIVTFHDGTEMITDHRVVSVFKN